MIIKEKKNRKKKTERQKDKKRQRERGTVKQLISTSDDLTCDML
jgi:hypothetical protein